MGMDAAVPFITMEDVSLRTDGGIPFRHVHWQILSDQNWAVAGPNASGKSTLMKALCGQVPVVGGEIVYHFSNNGALPYDRIAYVAFDSQARVAGREGLYHQARWNIGVDRSLLSVSDYLSERQVKGLNPYRVVVTQPDPSGFLAYREEVVDRLGIGGLLDRGLWQVSNGERRKLMLARALLKCPRLLILDNPFTGLDTAARARLAALIGDLMQGEMRVVVVTNRLADLPPGISHVLVVEHNEIVAQGPAQKVVEGAAHRLGGPERGAGAKVVAYALQGHDERDDPGGRGTADRVLVDMTGVSVAYDGVQILAGIDWTVRQGEHWALLGPNGAGKTTLLSLILADNPQAYANHVALFGKRRGTGESIWEIKRRIGWVAPELHLCYPKHVPCLDVVCSGVFNAVGRHHPCSQEVRATARLWMERLGVSHCADLSLGRISEGEQRLVLIARALVTDPELLVLDEPCQGLDARRRDRVLWAVDAIGQGRKPSVIYVTHDPHALPQIIRHVLRLDKGRIVFRGRLRGPGDSGS